MLKQIIHKLRLIKHHLAANILQGYSLQAEKADLSYIIFMLNVCILVKRKMHQVGVKTARFKTIRWFSGDRSNVLHQMILTFSSSNLFLTCHFVDSKRLRKLNIFQQTGSGLKFQPQD